jgi:hypothetical protein
MMQRKSNPLPVLCFFIVLFFLTCPVSALAIPSGTPDPDFVVDIYKPDKTWNGTTLFADCHKDGTARIVEVNMLGEIVWQYVIPANLNQYTKPGFDVELLPNNNILFLLPRNGVYEVDRKGTVVWSYMDSKVSHDVDRLPNGNTLINHGNEDTMDDAQVVEVNPQGNIVWSWHAKDAFNKPPYSTVYKQGWTHSNAVTRLPNGDTMVSLRNFNLTVKVNPRGAVVWKYDWTPVGTNPHEPMLLPNGNLLASLPAVPDEAVELNPQTGQVVWRYTFQMSQPRHGTNRDADRLPNGNTLINDGNKLVEVTPDKEIVWQFTVRGLDMPLSQGTLAIYLFKSERIGYMDPEFSITSPQQGACSPKETAISIQYSDVDLNRIWYRIYDRTNQRWATEEITYVTNSWKDALTFEGKVIGQDKVTLDTGDYTLHVWAASTGWGDENLFVPKKVITAEKTVDFSVTATCQATQPPVTLGGSPAPSPTDIPTKATPLQIPILLTGIGIAVLVAGLSGKWGR